MSNPDIPMPREQMDTKEPSKFPKELQEIGDTLVIAKDADEVTQILRREFILYINDLLSGAGDNAYINKWWQRPRKQLDNRSPYEYLLEQEWIPGDKRAEAIIEITNHLRSG